MLHEKVVASLMAALGSDSQLTFRGKRFLAYAYEASGRPTEAIPLHREVYLAWEKSRGETNAETLQALLDLARAMVDAADDTEAHDEAQQLAEMCIERATDAEQARWLKHYAGAILGAVAAKRGELDSAQQQLVTAYEAMHELSNVHPYRKARFADVLERLVRVAVAKEDDAQAGHWRQVQGEFLGE